MWACFRNGVDIFGITFSDATAYFIDEYLEYNLDELGVPDAPRLAILLAVTEPLTRYSFINNGRTRRLREGMLDLI